MPLRTLKLLTSTIILIHWLYLTCINSIFCYLSISFFIIVISYLKFFHHISQKTQICLTIILVPKMNFIYNYFQPLWGKDLLHTKEVNYGALYLNIRNILFLHGCLSLNWRNIYTLCKPLGVFCSPLWMTNVVAVMCSTNLFGMDYNYRLFNRWRCISYSEYLYEHFLNFFFLFLCLNGVHYYVLLKWAPALMGVSPSGCLHVFFSANKLSLREAKTLSQLLV